MSWCCARPGINAALAVDYHYLNEFQGESKSLATFVDLQYSVYQDFPGGTPPNVHRGSKLPDPVLSRGSLFVVGDCAGVYWSTGTRWVGVARSQETGEYRLRVKFDPVSEPTWEPLLVSGEPGKLQVLAAQIKPDNKIRFGFWSQGHANLPHGERSPEGFFTGPQTRLVPGEEYTLKLLLDSNNGRVGVERLNENGAFNFDQIELTAGQLSRYVFPSDRITIAKNDVGAPTTETLLGTVSEEPDRRPAICENLPR